MRWNEQRTQIHRQTGVAAIALDIELQDSPGVRVERGRRVRGNLNNAASYYWREVRGPRKM